MPDLLCLLLVLIPCAFSCHPTAVKKHANAGCPADWESVPEAQCLAAAKKLFPGVRWYSHVSDGNSWLNKDCPSGCSVYKTGEVTYYNRMLGRGGDKHRKTMICHPIGEGHPAVSFALACCVPRVFF